VRRLFNWASSAATHQGNVRAINQDAFLDRPDLGLWAVADGMGGHEHGERASALVVERLATLSRPRFLGQSARRAASLIADANRRLVDDAEALGGSIIGTTVVALLAVGSSCALLWVGDSRIYRLRAGRLEQLTTDHTEVQQWVSAGTLSPEDAELHPYAGVLSRAVGAADEVIVDRRIETLRDGDRYLLCSDGLTKELDARRIATLLGAGAPGQTAQMLIEEACAAGGRDNVTVLIVEFRSAR
jgi:protein phosphatase